MLLILLYAVPLLAAVSADYCEQEAGRPLVAIREGLVRGAIARSADGRLFYSFKGIPYAQAPVGALRFQPPLRHPGWSDVADCLTHGSVCPQYVSSALKGSEDCLLANVYTPRLPRAPSPTGGLPVMVFIHSDGFPTGSGDDDLLGPHYFMDEDVVLVTFNYRLGALGFFTTHDSHAPGNYGLLDQVLLLDWVQDNIAAFGGDPNSVTIFGESHGAIHVSILVLSPLTRGLFHHAISQSGSVLVMGAVSGRQRNDTQKLADRLNCSTEDVKPMVECIRNQTWEDIMANTEEADLNFHARVDREAESPLLTNDPRTLLASGEFNLVPWMHGLTQEEGSPFVPILLANNSVTLSLFEGDLTEWGDFAELATTDTNNLDCGSDPHEEANKVYDFYIGDNTNSGNILPLIQAWGDRMILAPMTAEISLASRHVPVYRYLLDHTEADRLGFTRDDPWVPDVGTSHGDDILYLFSDNQTPLVARYSPIHDMIRFMVSLWTSFARTGRPSSALVKMPDWPVFNEHHQRHMRLDSEPSVGERLFQERADFWQTVRINEPWRHEVQNDCPKGPVERDGY